MRKLFLTLIMCLSAVFVFAETGALGVQWKTSEIKDQEKLFELSTENENVKFKTQEKVILRSKTPVFYTYFAEGKKYKLQAISYTLSARKIEMLKSNLKHVFTWNGLNENLLADYAETMAKEDIKNKASILTNYISSFISLLSEWEGENSLTYLYEEQAENKNAKVSIYDYNDDTRVYIYENFLEDSAVVVYVPHEKDY